LLVAPGASPALMRMAHNLQNVTVVTVQSVNLEDVLKHRSVAFLKDSIDAFEKIYV
jgi:ribosomal protein L4